MVPTVRVGRFLGRAEAEVARGFLEAQGIEARVLADDAAGLRPDVAFGYGGVTLAVHPDDVELAEELLAAADATPRAPRDAPRSLSRRLVPLALALMVAVAWLLGSDAITGWSG
ncbi:MAG: hypothetical protein IH998_09640 [Proteobacteria bacterium]|nr:hypothetical protein [Pseudomonadota bacterium]